MSLKDRLRLDPRHRQGLTLAALIYLVGYVVGKSNGLERAVDALTHGSPDQSA